MISTLYFPQKPNLPRSRPAASCVPFPSSFSSLLLSLMTAFEKWLDPPERMDLIEDHVRPTNAEAKSILTKSYETWSSCSKDISRYRQLQPESAMLRRMLGKVPEFLPHGVAKGSYPNNLKISIRGSGRDSCLVIGGKSTWRTTEGDCDLEDKVLTQDLLFGIQTSKTCSFATGLSLTDWPGIRGGREGPVEGNHLGIVALAWAYILSARWIELQKTEPGQPNQKNPRSYYLDPQAERQYGSQGSPGYTKVCLGDVDEEAWRWWAAILATGEGWRVEIDGNRRAYRSPWSIFIETGTPQQFKLRGKFRRQRLKAERLSPPSSQKALGFLANYCKLHHLKGQCSIALAATLFIPCHKKITFPLPVMRMDYPTASVPSYTNHEDVVFEEAKLLPYYMTMSAHVKFMGGLLMSSLYEPEVPCNLVDAWLQPFFEIIDPLVESGDFVKIAMIMGNRQPKLSALWLGVVISGSLEHILRAARAGLFPVIPEATAWTDIPQSFMFLKPQPGTIRTENFLEIISRSRECQLLHLADPHNRSIPSMPWKPFGNTSICDTDLMVRKHADCLGHYLQYQSWSWELNDDTNTAEDLGLQSLHKDHDRKASRNGSEDPKAQPYSAEDDTDPAEICSSWGEYALELKPARFSEDATRHIFRWMRAAAGWPSAERGIFTHPWISRQRGHIEVYHDPEVIEPTPEERKEIEERNKMVEDWLDGIAES